MLRPHNAPRQPIFSIWESGLSHNLPGYAVPPIPLTRRHVLMPLFVERVDHRLFVLALAPDPNHTQLQAESRAIEARAFASRHLNPGLFKHIRPDY